ncbi:hypothetical protein C2E21_5243 [Chlorella sorokiniana]|uniref:Uncharacterized protein n=1 Tax=Chlorella sorokiniana TaxID=3076 RepID=A0A2P6TPQ9_CHLSO|nr:hypothetical protein C2E21_5243 [Chlorella sorokiniana]|eukprot:PRW56008.1 hypothetical protein C2E21_5243 [Chlorella sorokiniana]
MIVYRKAFLGLHLLFRLYGSAVLRTAIWGLIAAFQTTMLYVFVDNTVAHWFALSSGSLASYSVFTTMLALLVIFRQQAGYGRFHEGRTKLQAMSAAWTDACIKFLDFDGGSAGYVPPDASTSRFRQDTVHMFSLLHGLAMQFLRSDWRLENLSEHDSTRLPAWDSANSSTYTPSLIDYFVLRSISARRLRYNAAHPIPVVGQLRPTETGHLHIDSAQRTVTIDREKWAEACKDGLKGRQSLFMSARHQLQSARHHLFTNSQGKYVRGAAERVYQVFQWLHARCRQRMAEGGLDMPAPILATAYQSLSRGLEAFEGCRYLCDTPFPFSWAQLLIVMLLCFQFTLPFAVVSAITDKGLGIALATIVALAYWTLNEVSREMEDPYCFEPNDIPLARLQYQFNERILAAATAQLPAVVDDDLEFRKSLQLAFRSAASGSLGAPDAAMATEDAEVLPAAPAVGLARVSAPAVPPMAARYAAAAPSGRYPMPPPIGPASGRYAAAVTAPAGAAAAPGATAAVNGGS